MTERRELVVLVVSVGAEELDVSDLASQRSSKVALRPKVLELGALD